MYEAFYGLRERPFNLTPDPKYLYLSEKHKEAFAHLLYGIKNRSGFVMISGEIGTGKTTLCRNLLNQMDASTEVAFIFNPFLNPIELMKKINHEFGIRSQADTILALTEELNVHLLHSAAHGKNCVLVIDEAQNLAPPVLEQIRLLSNLETDSEKLLQIILIGQPELAEKLALRELRQLNQRITARYHLKALNALETLQYIAYRLHVAGSRKRLNFTKGAVKLIYRRSGGVPRMINAITDRALLIGYTKEKHVITARIVRRATREIRGEKVTMPKERQFRWRRWLPSPSLAALVIVMLALAHYLVDPLDRFARELSVFNRILSGDSLATPQTEQELYGASATADAREEEAPVLAALPPSEHLGALHRVMERLNAAEPTRPSQALTPLLAELQPGESVRAGLDMLVSLWNRALVEGDLPEAFEPESLTAFFAAHGLSCEHLRPTMDQMFTINLPCLARMVAGEREFWMGVLRADDETITLQAGVNRRVTVPLSEFSMYYGRELLAPWKDPSPDTPVLLPGNRGPQVRALKAQLRALGRLAPDNTSDVYDKETETAILALQSETGLTADGKAGRQVRLALAGQSGDTPVLRRSGIRAGMNGEKMSRDSAKNSAAADATSSKRSTNASPPIIHTDEKAAPLARENAEEVMPVFELRDDESGTMALPSIETLASPSLEPLPETVSPSPRERGLFRLLREHGPVRDKTTDEDAGLTEVRELSDPFKPEAEALPETSRQPDITAPVFGSAPLIPREEPRP